ncbi:MAG: UDP-3-O-(3-hydroxymyristoyl)glucosamine N-acyltransferase [Proteobacteria bacterium]|nr:UDP-3-O-(3-hydroxymyristoyl)glucosamine N-acyltransferase [Pseudomonadota bacterium]
MLALPLLELARRIGGALTGGDEAQRITGVDALGAAGPGAIAPLLDDTLWDEVASSRAGALLVRRARAGLGRAQIASAEPRRSLGLLIELYRPPPRWRRGRHPTAVVDQAAEVAEDAYLGPHCVVEAEARVGSGSQLEAGSFLGPGVVVGARCRIGPHAVILADCQLADDVVVAAGAVIGAAGFGYWRDQHGQWQSVGSLGSVRIERGAELGANSCVDRATVGVTRVGVGSKIDNLVQIGHNVQLGRDVLLCAQVGLAGSVRIEDGAQLGGQVGVADHLTVGRGARVAGGSGVVRRVPAEATVGGYPAIDQRQWLRSSALAARLVRTRARVAGVQESPGLGPERPAPSSAGGSVHPPDADEGANNADD